MKNKLIVIFSIVGAVAAVAGVIAYVLNFKKEFGGMLDSE